MACFILGPIETALQQPDQQHGDGADGSASVGVKIP
jgi:hypothetical protein